jgi:hypothetical protein
MSVTPVTDQQEPQPVASYSSPEQCSSQETKTCKCYSNKPPDDANPLGVIFDDTLRLLPETASP